jgi:tyrosyl-tRNA synthetase
MYQDHLEGGENPKNIKTILAKEIVKMYHDEKSAEKAAEVWEETFSKGGIPTDVEEISVASGTKLKNVLVENKIVESNSEFARLLSAGAIKNAETEEKINSDIEITSNQILKVGKRRFVKIMVK